jgi:4-hydroxy-3-methylbut-2-enyl diphosphate reductase
MDKRWLDGVQSIGVTAGASAPEVLIQEVLQQLQDWGGDLPSELSGIEENVTFSLPKALRIPVTQVGK